jgi:hypothetical protein
MVGPLPVTALMVDPCTPIRRVDGACASAARRSRVRGEIQRLVERLRDPRPVRPCGVALTRRVLSDGTLRADRRAPRPGCIRKAGATAQTGRRSVCPSRRYCTPTAWLPVNARNRAAAHGSCSTAAPLEGRHGSTRCCRLTAIPDSSNCSRSRPALPPRRGDPPRWLRVRARTDRSP